MEKFNSSVTARPWTAAIAAGILTSVLGLPSAHGELVYEDSPAAAVNAPAASPADAARVDERGTLRQALGASERAQATRQAELPARAAAPQGAAAPVYQVPLQAQAPVALQAAPAPVAAVVSELPAEGNASARPGDSAEDIRNMNKAELMRRERVREEVRNEDALQERLEELRLRDEKRRSDQILGVSGAPAGQAQASGVNLPNQLYDQPVVAPVTERPGQAPVSPQIQNAAAPAQAGGVQLAGISAVNAADQGANPSVITTSVDLEKSKDKSTFFVSGRAGMGGMSSKEGFNVNPRFAGGFAVGLETSDYLGFEASYTYAEYGVNVGSSNPYIQEIQTINSYNGNTHSDTLAMKTNIVDAGLKLHLLDKSSRLRPFLGGGGAWSKGYVNYDQAILNRLQSSGYYNSNNPLMNDWEFTQYLGYVSGGLDVKMNQNITVGLMAKYYAVLSSSENSSLNAAAFLPNYANNTAPEKSAAGDSLSRSSFYTILGNVTFSF